MQQEWTRLLGEIDDDAAIASLALARADLCEDYSPAVEGRVETVRGLLKMAVILAVEEYGEDE